ncbi:MAG: hypothetical protein M3Y28_11690, partial [Armatimonadota bacterium]|nr:hypothetical protein [Armatimonadota bacterium]
MSLDVTFGTSGTGLAPPSPSGLAGVVGAGTPASDLATLFAALLANTAQASSAPPAKGVTPATSPPTEVPSRGPSRRSDDDPPNEDPNQSPAAPDAALTMLLMALTAPPITLKTVLEKPMPPAPPATSRVGNAPEITKPITLGQTTLGQTNQEAMDTVPAPAPSAPSVKQDDNADGGLLPLSLNSSAPLTTALSVPLPVTSRNSTSSPTAASLPATAVSASVAGVIPTPVTAPGPAHVSPPPADTPVMAAPVMAAPVVTSAPFAPPTMVSLNDIRPDTLNSPGLVSAAAPGLETALPRLLPPTAQNTPALAASQPAPASNAAVPTPAQAAVLVQTVLQNEPQPANNTGMPTPKANETTAKPTEAVHAGATSELIAPTAVRMPDPPAPAKQMADTSGQTLPSVGSSVSGTPQRETDGEKPSGQAAVADTVLMENAASLTTSAPMTTGPQSA